MISTKGCFSCKKFLYSTDKTLAKPKNMLSLLIKHYLEGSWIIQKKGF
jgi:hypothetical protein